MKYNNGKSKAAEEKTGFMSIFKERPLLHMLLSAVLIVTLSGCGTPEERKQNAFQRGVELSSDSDVRRAILEFRNAIQIDPGFTEARYQLGLCLIKQQRYSAALSEFRKVREEMPGLAELSPYLAEALVGAGEYEEGANFCETLITDTGGSANLYDLWARALLGLSEEERIHPELDGVSLHEQHLIRAKELALKALDLDPSLAEPHMTQARVLIGQHRNTVRAAPLSTPQKTELQSHFDAAKNNDKDNAALMCRIASSWSIAGEQDEAMRAIHAVLSISPDDAGARLMKAELLFSRGDVDEASAMAKTLAEHDTSGGGLDFLLGRILLNNGEAGEAAGYFRKVRNNSQGGYFYAVCLEQLGKRQQALSQFERVIDQMPAHEGARRALFNIYLEEGNFIKASIEADDTLKILPSSPLGRVMQARLYIAQDDWGKTQEAIDACLQHTPGLVEAFFIQAELYRSMGEFDQAYETLSDLVDRYPEMPLAYRLRAEIALDLREYEQAERDALMALELEPEESQPHTALARIHLARGELENAKEAYERALALDPGNTSYRLALSELLAATGAHEEALAQLELVKQGDSHYVQARKHVAEILDAMGDSDAALAEFNKLVAEHPDAADATMGLFQHLWRARAFDEAEQLAKVTAAKNPRNAVGHMLLAEILSAQRRWPEAVEEMAKVVALQPNSTRSLLQLGILNFRAGRHSDALDALRRAQKLKPEFDAAALWEAQVLAGLGQIDQAETMCQNVLERDSGNWNARLSMADIKVRQGKLDEAESLYQEIIAAQPGFLLTYLRLAALYEKAERTAEGAKVFEKALAVRPEIGELHVKYGQFWERNNDKERARQEYLSALAVSPANAIAQKAVARLSAETGDYVAAEEQLRNRIAKEPRDLQAQLNLALVLQKQDRADEATKLLLDFLESSGDPEAAGFEVSRLFAQIREYGQIERMARSLLEADADSWLAHYVLGVALAGQEDIKTARQHFSQAAALNPEMPLARHAEGLAYARLNQVEDALTAFEAAREIDEGFLPAYTDAAALHMNAEDYARAEQLCERAISVKPPANGVQILLALVHTRSGDPVKALGVTAKLLGNTPGEAARVSVVADLLSTSGNHDAAISLAKQCISAAPEANPVLVMKLARNYERADRFDDAEETYQRLVAMAPNSAAAHNNLAWVLAKRGELDEALGHALEAQELTPGYPSFQDTLGWIQFKRGDLQEAVRTLESAVQGAQDSPDILYHLAKAYAAAGRNDDARPLLETALSQDANFSGAEDARSLLAGLSR